MMLHHSLSYSKLQQQRSTMTMLCRFVVIATTTLALVLSVTMGSSIVSAAVQQDVHHRRVYANHVITNNNSHNGGGLFRATAGINSNKNEQDSFFVDRNPDKVESPSSVHRRHRRVSAANHEQPLLPSNARNARRFLKECALGTDTTFYLFNFDDGTLVTGSTSSDKVLVTLDETKDFTMDVTCGASYEDMIPAVASYELVKCTGGNVYETCDSTELVVATTTASSIAKGSKKAKKTKGDKKKKKDKKTKKGDKQKKGKKDDLSMSYSMSFEYDETLMLESAPAVYEEGLEWIVVKGAGKKTASKKADKKTKGDKKKGKDKKTKKGDKKTKGKKGKDNMDMSMSMSFSYDVAQTYFYQEDRDAFSVEEILAALPPDSVLHALVEERLVEEELSYMTQELRSSVEDEESVSVIASTSNSSSTIAMAASAAGLMVLATSLVVVAKKLVAHSSGMAASDAEGTFAGGDDGSTADEYDVVDLQ